MSSILLIVTFFAFAFVAVHGFFILLSFLGTRAFHRQKLKEVLGIGFKSEAYDQLRKDSIF